jgi:hypothetical protein
MTTDRIQSVILLHGFFLGGVGADKSLQKKGNVTKRYTGFRTWTCSLERPKQMEYGCEIQSAKKLIHIQDYSF